MRRRALLATVTALVVAAGLVIVWRAARPEPIVLAQATKRPFEARLSDARADRFRPYAGGTRAGGTREEVRVDTLAQLAKRADWRGLADACLLDGQLDRAAAALERAGASADVASDRAALALLQHDPAAALAHATRALALAPGLPQAAWNRALALGDLELVHAATGAFAAIAARGEKGWADEAKARAAALRGELAGERDRARRPAPEAGAAYEQARAALQKGDAAGAEAQARAGLAQARDANLDPTDLPRRFYVLLADAARAQGKTALADAYVDEARLVMP
ncbi:MAG TPA: hypothetical protein VF334_09440 [Polyangia bacterium]